MRLWTREIAGWLLVLLGLFVFFRCYTLLTAADSENPRILEGAALSLVGIIIFRGGIHLLKIAVAARVCLEAQERLEPERAKSTVAAAAGRGPARPLPGRRLS